MTLTEVARITLVRPFVLSFREPIVFFLNIYIALVYGMFSSRSDSLHINRGFSAVLYVYITSIDVVFIEKHHFNLGQNGLAFMVCLILLA